MLRKPSKVLVVEDDDLIRESLCELLSMEGFEVTLARNGREALDRLAELNPAPSVVLLDLMMPVMTGWEFLESIGKDPRYSSIPVVVLSAVSENSKNLAAKAFLKKPIDAETLLETIKRYC